MNKTPKDNSADETTDTNTLSLEEIRRQQQEETLAQRSARLEAEALSMRDQQSTKDSENGGEDEKSTNTAPETDNTQTQHDYDPLAPDPDAFDYNPSESINIGGGSPDILALQKELDETKDKLMRAVAETENMRRRSLKEREDARKYSIAGFSRDILSVADNLRRAIEAISPELIEQDEQVKNLLNGIEATERELLRTFEKNGIKKLEPILDGDGEIFDPNLHEVMFEAPIPGKPAGTIIQVMETGYMLHDRLLRPARVGVAKDDDSNTTEPPHIDTEA